MDNHKVKLQPQIPSSTHDYLARRLDGARDLYLLALALGQRGNNSGEFGRLISEARIHFSAVIEEAKLAGLDTAGISQVLGDDTHKLVDSLRPEFVAALQRVSEQRAPATVA